MLKPHKNITFRNTFVIFKEKLSKIKSTAQKRRYNVLSPILEKTVYFKKRQIFVGKYVHGFLPENVNEFDKRKMFA